MDETWVNPSEIMKYRLKNKRKVSEGLPSEQACKQSALSQTASADNLVKQAGASNSSVKRNPFSRTTKLSLKMSSEKSVGSLSLIRRSASMSDFNSDNSNSGFLIQMLNQQNSMASEDLSDIFVSDYPVEESLFKADSTVTPFLQKQEEEERDIPANTGTEYPCDWNIKSKVRFFSENAFDWCWPIKSRDESSGFHSFIHSDSFSNPAINDDSAMFASSLEKCCLYWIHPNLPWLQLYPRISSDLKTGKASAVGQDQEIRTALLASWSESFTSAFHMVLYSHCPYFYLCTPNFTALFRAAGVAGEKNPHVLIAPTTRGFREALKNEGISFKMPFEESYKSSEDKVTALPRATSFSGVLASSRSPCPQQADGNEGGAQFTVGSGEMEKQETGEEEEDQDEDDKLWLQNLGVNKKRLRTIGRGDAAPSQIHPSLDHRPQSLVIVEDACNMRSLFNYLLNCRTCFANTGPQLGIPPTILAPAAFKNASISQLKVRTGKISKSAVQSKELHVLDVSGPLLPTTVKSFCDLFAKSQRSFTANFSCDDVMRVFNTSSGNVDTDTTTENNNNQGLVYRTTSLERTALQSVVYENDVYRWTTTNVIS